MSLLGYSKDFEVHITHKALPLVVMDFSIITQLALPPIH